MQRSSQSWKSHGILFSDFCGNPDWANDPRCLWEHLIRHGYRAFTSDADAMRWKVAQLAEFAPRLHDNPATIPWESTCFVPFLRAVPEIILGGGTFFFRPLHPQDTHGVRAPRPPGHVSALINLPHYGSNTPWPPGQVTPPPPLGHTVNKTPSPHRTKKCLCPPEDNFWNSPWQNRQFRSEK